MHIGLYPCNWKTGTTVTLLLFVVIQFKQKTLEYWLAAYCRKHMVDMTKRTS